MIVEDFIISRRTITALKKAGFNELSDFEGKTKQEIKDIKGIGNNGYLELLEWLSINGKPLKFAPKPKSGPRYPKEASTLVKTTLKGQNINYGAEVKIAAALIARWGVEPIFAAVKDLAPPTLYSLKYFMGFWFEKAIQKYLPVEIILQKTVEKKPVKTVELEKVEYIPLAQPPQTLENFLKRRK